MEDLTKLNLLYDYYGELLTEKQREFFELYYFNDYSLGEISENYGITRQGVYDNIRRAQEILCLYEKKLGIVKKIFILEKRIKDILSRITSLKEILPDSYKVELDKIYNSIALLLTESGE